MTSVKVCNNGKIHKLSKLPESLSSLQDSIKQILEGTLPNSYILQYEDLEGDHVMLASEEDYKAMLVSELPKDPSKSLRIHVVSRDKPDVDHNREQFCSGMQNFAHSDNKDIHEQIQEGNNNIQNLNVKPQLKQGNNEEFGDSSDEEEKDDRSRDDFGPGGKEKRHKYGFGDVEKDELKKQKKIMKKEIKVQRMVKKTEVLKEAITEALFDNLPTIAKVVKSYIDDPTMNLEETVQNVRPKTNLGTQLEDHEGLHAHFKRPFLMFRSLIDVYRGLTDEQKTETNKLLGGIPEKLLTGDHEKTKEGGPWGGPGPWFGHGHGHHGGPGGPWGGHGGPGGPWGGPRGPWGGPGGPWGDHHWGHRHGKGEWNSEKSEEQSQEGKWRHKHHHYKKDKEYKDKDYKEKDYKEKDYKEKDDKDRGYKDYKEKKDKYEEKGGSKEGEWKKRTKEGGYEEKKREKKDWRAKEEENVGSEFRMELVKEVGTVPPKVSVSDGTIYKTVVIKNTGAVEWPRSALLVPRGEVWGENVRLTNVKPGQEYTPVLVLKGPGKAGNFVTEWKLAYKDEQGKNYFTGASISVGLSVSADS